MSFTPNHGNFFDNLSLNRYFIGKAASESLEGTVQGSYDALQSSWNQDGRTFSHIASAYTAPLRGFVDTGTSFVLAAGMRARMSGFGRDIYEDAGHTLEDGSTWIKSGERKFTKLGTTTTETFKDEAEVAKFLKGSKTKDLWMKSGTTTDGKVLAAELAESGEVLGGFRGMLGKFGSAKGAFALAAIQMGTTALINKATSVVGGLMDESYNAYQQSKMPHYDTRMFNNKMMQQWGQQAQGAMMNYEMNNFSISRQYHSRG